MMPLICLNDAFENLPVLSCSTFNIVSVYVGQAVKSEEWLSLDLLDLPFSSPGSEPLRFFLNFCIN